MPCTVYLDDIAVYGDDPEQVLRDTAEAIRRLAKAGFMLNLKKSHLCETTLKVLGHRWVSGGYWLPEPARLEALVRCSDAEVKSMGRSNVYGLLNFYREYVPTFPEVTESLRLILGHDQVPWTKQAIEAVRDAARRALAGVPWIAFDPEHELRIETRVVAGGMAIIGLQSNPQNKKKWLPVISWGRVLDKPEREMATPLLELRALQEGLHKLGAYTAFAKTLTIRASPQLQALYKLARRAHPALQAALIDIACYSPQWVL